MARWNVIQDTGRNLDTQVAERGRIYRKKIVVKEI